MPKHFASPPTSARYRAARMLLRHALSKAADGEDRAGGMALSRRTERQADACGRLPGD